MLIVKNGLFIFRRDLRIDDNMALHHATTQCENVFTCFIFTPEQVGPTNSYKSNNAVQFMVESLEDLAADIKTAGGELSTFYGKNKSVVRDLIDVLQIDAVYFNRDYTPYALIRDDEIARLCKKMDIKCSIYQDYYLYETEEGRKFLSLLHPDDFTIKYKYHGTTRLNSFGFFEKHS